MIRFEHKTKFTNKNRVMLKIWANFLEKGEHSSATGASAAYLANRCIEEKVPFQLERTTEEGRPYWVIRTKRHASP